MKLSIESNVRRVAAVAFYAYSVLILEEKGGRRENIGYACTMRFFFFFFFFFVFRSIISCSFLFAVLSNVSYNRQLKDHIVNHVFFFFLVAVSTFSNFTSVLLSTPGCEWIIERCLLGLCLGHREIPTSKPRLLCEGDKCSDCECRLAFPRP